IFTVVNAVLLKPLPYADPERLTQIWESPPRGGRNVVNALNFLDWKERTRSFEDMAAIGGGTANLTGAGDPMAVDGALVTPSYFSVLGAGAAIGRTFTEADGRPGAPQVAVLSYSLWKSRFGGDPAAVGRTAIVNGTPRTIIGVMPATFSIPRGKADLWAPIAVTRDPKRFGSGRSLMVVARLKP